MNKKPFETESPVPPRTTDDHFVRFSAASSNWLGSKWAFLGAGCVVALWVASGPFFGFSGVWPVIISTVTSIVTFLMVFLIQNTQNRDARTIHLKLNELIRAMDSARNQMIDIERLTDLELDAMQVTYEKVKTAWTERQSRGLGGHEEK